MDDDNVLHPAQVLSSGKKYKNENIVYIDKIQLPKSPINNDVSENNYNINVGNLNAEYSGADGGKYIFKLLQETTLTGQPERILPTETTITLKYNTGKFKENTNIIDDTNKDPKVGDVIKRGLTNGLNKLSDLAGYMYKGDPVLSGAGKLSKTKSKTRKLKRRQRNHHRQHKKTKSRSKKRKSKKLRSRSNRK